MKAATASIALALAAVAACGAPREPLARPGLWRQTITLKGAHLDLGNPPAPIVNEICVGSGGHISLPYYRAHSSQDCDADAFARQPNDVWTSRTVCRHPDGGVTTVEANVWGDFNRIYGVAGRVSREDGSETYATVVGEWQGACPAGHLPGVQRPLGS